MQLLHVVPRLDTGGAARTAVDLIKALRGGINQAVISLAPATASKRADLETVGVDLVEKPDDLAERTARADIVLLHFWNTPATYEFLQTPLPAMRLATWVHVSGLHAPQVITPALAEFADAIVVTSPASLELPQVKTAQSATYLPALIDFSRLTPPPERGFRSTVGYLGVVDFVKMHRDFVGLCSGVKPRQIGFSVWGPGNAYATLRREADVLGSADRFSWNGPTEDVSAAYSKMDVFGYPLCADTYATSDRVLAEAMWSKLPIVVFQHPAMRPFVGSGQTGFAVSSSGEYVDALERLMGDHKLRRELGEQAADHIATEFSSTRTVARICEVFDDLMRQSRRTRLFNGGRPRLCGAELFIESLGDEGDTFRASMAQTGTDMREYDVQISRASPALANSGGGGIIHYRLTYDSDPYLRFWSGLVFAQNGRPALARGEFEAARRLGMSEQRINFQVGRLKAYDATT